MKEPVKKHLSFTPLHHDIFKKPLKLQKELRKSSRRIPHKIVNFKAAYKSMFEATEHKTSSAYSVKQCLHSAGKVLSILKRAIGNQSKDIIKEEI